MKSSPDQTNYLVISALPCTFVLYRAPDPAVAGPSSYNLVQETGMDNAVTRAVPIDSSATGADIAGSDAVAVTTIASDWLLDLANRLCFGVIVAGPSCTPLFVNTCAKELLDRKDGLILQQGRLAALRSDVTRLLQNSVAHATRHGVAAPRRGSAADRSPPLTQRSERIARHDGDRERTRWRHARSSFALAHVRVDARGSATCAAARYGENCRRSSRGALYQRSHGADAREADIAEDRHGPSERAAASRASVHGAHENRLTIIVRR
jgi:hypothetical protein